MTEPLAPSAAQDMPLPDPRDEPPSARGALRDADQAAWHARRLLDASRGVLTGTLALGCCLPATLMVWWEAGGDPSRLLAAAVTIGFVVWAAVALRWLVRQRSAGGVRVVDRIEANLKAIGEHPFRRLAPSYLLVFGAFLAWSFLFKVMPDSGVVIAMWAVAAVLTGVFAVRFLRFRFWEDLVFSASVAAAWGLYLLRPGRLEPLAVVPPLAVIAGTVCLHRRWRDWVRSLPTAGAAAAPPGGRP